jgi:hypothetical protein
MYKASREQFMRFVTWCMIRENDILDEFPGLEEYWEGYKNQMPRTFEELIADGASFFESKGVVFNPEDDAPNLGGREEW